jgi:hypothetical protein
LAGNPEQEKLNASLVKPDTLTTVLAEDPVLGMFSVVAVRTTVGVAVAMVKEMVEVTVAGMLSESVT